MLLLVCVWTSGLCAAPAWAAGDDDDETAKPAAEAAAKSAGKSAKPKAKAGDGKAAKSGEAKAPTKPDASKPDASKPDSAKPDSAKPESSKGGEETATPVGDDATKLGPFQPPPRPFPFPLLGDDKAREIFVDRAGNLYKERPYSGNVPDWNTAAAAAGGRCKVEAQALTWLGFQNNADGSRIYVQVENAACGYVYRPDDLHIVIDLPQVSLTAANFGREILTGAFPTAVEQVRAEDVPGKGTRVVIVLRERRPYLSAHLGRYLFVDVTR